MRPIHLFSALAGAATILFGSLAYTNNGNPPTATTGAPGQQNCSRCHGTATTNANRFQISITDTAIQSFSPGETVPIRVEHIGSGVKNGFEFTALKAATTNAAGYGTLARVSTTLTGQSTIGGRTYIYHTTSGNQRTSWDMTWTAPTTTTDTNAVYFYAAGVASNNNNRDDAGDATFLAKLRLPRFTPTTGVAERILVAQSVKTYPNPCTDAVHIDLSLTKPAPVGAQLYNTAGMSVEARTFLMDAGKQTIRWTFDRKPAAGTYIIHLTAGGYVTARTIVVQ